MSWEVCTCFRDASHRACAEMLAMVYFQKGIVGLGTSSVPAANWYMKGRGFSCDMMKSGACAMGLWIDAEFPGRVNVNHFFVDPVDAHPMRLGVELPAHLPPTCAGSAYSTRIQLVATQNGPLRCFCFSVLKSHLALYRRTSGAGCRS
jgi:hypothetical protein